jgi:hypothetical protein
MTVKLHATLEKLIEQYEASIWGDSIDEIERLCRAVEAEGQRIGYQNHVRLMSLHTWAEKACIRLSNRKEDA